MSQPYLGEIRMFGGSFAPEGWAFCNGQSVPISEYDSLYSLIGTTYGGDGLNTFNLPDLQCRVPVHMGNGFIIAQRGGEETITLTQAQLPSHSHAMQATTTQATDTTATGDLPAQPTQFNVYLDRNPATAMAPNAVTVVGGNAAHDNLQPFACVTFIIALYGIYPVRT